MSIRLRAILSLLAPLPALVVGVLVMQRSGVSSSIWQLQLAVGFILTIACFIVCVRRRRITSRTSTSWTLITALGALIILASTMLHAGVNGIHRWIALGPLQLHAGFVALPILIILFSVILRSDNSRARWVIGASIMIAAAILAIQPDASQAIELATAMLFVVLMKRSRSRIDWITTAVCFGASALALSRPDPLEAVPYVEGIVRLAAERGATWMAASIVALMLLPIPFIAHFLKHRNHAEGAGLAAYFVTACIAAFVAPFPFPILGYGLSPLLGYFVVLGWVVRTDTYEKHATS